MKKIFLLLSCLLPIFSYGQDSFEREKIIPVSPQAASLGKFVEIPVGYYTGIPQITIPVFTIQSNELSIPISLDYHGGGIKVEEVAAPTGLGWALTAGGAIIQQTRGLPDQEFGSGYMTTAKEVAKFSSYSIDDKILYGKTSIQENAWDTEPDIFFYNFNGNSGKFFLDKDGQTIRTIPLSDFKISYDKAQNSWQIITGDGTKYVFSQVETTENISSGSINSNKSSAWFISKITSPNGTDEILFNYGNEYYSYRIADSQIKHIDAKNNGGLECRLPTFSGNTNSVTVNSKVLTSIKFSLGTVKFIRNTIGREDLPGSYTLNSIEIYDGNNILKKKANLSYVYGGINSKRLFLSSVKFVDPKGLAKSEDYTFDYADKDLLPATTSYAQDYWGYFNNATNSNLIPTMQILDFNYNNLITIQGADRETKFSYSKAGTLISMKFPTGAIHSFEYESNTAYNKTITYSVKKYSGSASVHTEYNTNFEPKLTYELKFSTDRDNAGIEYSFNNGPAQGKGTPGPRGLIYDANNKLILSIPYPITGATFTIPLKGNYRFFIDYSSFSDLVDVFHFDVKFLAPPGTVDTAINIRNENVGGIRLKILNTTDPITGKTLTKKYTYTNPDNITYSSGYLVSRPKNLKTVALYCPVSIPIGQRVIIAGTKSLLYNRLSSYSNSPLTTTGGSFVGYSHVTELFGENGEIGKKEYFYTSPYDEPDKVNGELPPVSREHHRGKLTDELTFNFKNGKFNLIKSLHNDYYTYGYQAYHGLKFLTETTTPTIIDRYFLAEYHYYDIETDAFNIKKQSIRTYDDNNNYITNETNYFYKENYVQLDKELHYDSKATGRSIIYRYPQDMVRKGVSNPYQEMVNRNMINQVIENEQQINDVKNYLTVKKYSQSWPGYSSLILPSIVTTQNKQDPEEIRYQYLNYDSKGNPLEVNKPNGSLISYIWDYNQSFPIAEIHNSTLQANNAYTSFEADGKGNLSFNAAKIVADPTVPIGKKCYTLSTVTSDYITKSGLTASQTYALSYWVKSGAALTITGATLGIPTTVRTLNGWTLYSRTVSNATAINFYGTGFIDDIRLCPLDAQMTAYTYDPLVGMTSATDAKGQTSYYEYDEFGRLKYIKDADGNILTEHTYNYKQ